MHLTLVPYIAAAKELKTKPTQHSVKELRSIGIQPDILLLRAEREIPASERKKVALFCNLPEEAVFQALDAKSIYQVPLAYHAEGLDAQVLRHFKLEESKPELKDWQRIVSRYEKPEGEVTVAIVGKYTGMGDAYKSLNEALDHAGIAHNVRVNQHWLDAKGFEKQDVAKKLERADAVLVPGGFGERGVEGKIAAIHYARENKLPYFGICFGMQMAVVEYARNVLGIKDATSTEFGTYTGDDPRGPIIGLMTEWVKGNEVQKRSGSEDMGGTMRLGAYDCHIQPGSLLAGIYGKTDISERHRHRYELNITYKDDLEKAGLKITGLSPSGLLPEMVELAGHPWFVGVQFHPELKSRPFAPHPLFASFIEAAIAHERKTQKTAEYA
jgi:CTP synthase